MDTIQLLEEFVPTIENVPGEIQFLLTELSAKDADFHALRESIHSNDMQLRKLIRNGPQVAGQPATAAAAPIAAENTTGASATDSAAAPAGAPAPASDAAPIPSGQPLAKPDPDAPTDAPQASEGAAASAAPASPPKAREARAPPESPSKSPKRSPTGKPRSDADPMDADKPPTSEPAGASDAPATESEAAEKQIESNPVAETEAARSAGAASAEPALPASTTRPTDAAAPAQSSDPAAKDAPVQTAPAASGELEHSTGNLGDEMDADGIKDADPRLAKLRKATRAQLQGIPDQVSLYLEIQKEFARCKRVADEKVQLAEHMREMFDRHLRRFNAELEKLDEQDIAALGPPLTASAAIGAAAVAGFVGGAAGGSMLGAGLPGASGFAGLSTPSGASSAGLAGLGAPASTTLGINGAGTTLLGAGSSSTASSFLTPSASSLTTASGSFAHLGGVHGALAAHAASASLAGDSITAAGGSSSSLILGPTIVPHTPLQSSGSSYSLLSASGLGDPMQQLQQQPQQQQQQQQQQQRSKREQSLHADTIASTPLSSQSAAHKRKTSGGSRPMIQKRSHKRKSEAGGSFSGSAVRSATPEMDEQLYCFCQQVSYGEMIACDNEDCPHEWFHLECVGLSEPPTGVWYCKDCVQSTKARRSR